MGSPAVPARTLTAVRLLQTSCGLLVAASLVALGQPSRVFVAHDGAATVASAHPAVPTEWAPGGPLAIPTIGVVPPGSADWFAPAAEPVFRSPRGPLSTASVLLPSTSTPYADPLPSPGLGTPPPVSPSPTAPRTDMPTTGTGPSATTPTTTASRTTTPRTTASQTTTEETTTPPPSTSEPTRTEEPLATRPAPTTNERGNVVLDVGEELVVVDGTTGAAAFAIAVDGAPSDAVCTDPAGTPAANGRLIAVTLHVTTGPGLSAVGGEPSIGPADFRFLAPDDTTLTDAGTPSAALCLPDTEEFPAGPIAPDQDLVGVVVLDVPATAGRLVFAPDFLPVGAEWEYGPPAAK